MKTLLWSRFYSLKYVMLDQSLVIYGFSTCFTDFYKIHFKNSVSLVPVHPRDWSGLYQIMRPNYYYSYSVPLLLLGHLYHTNNTTFSRAEGVYRCCSLQKTPLILKALKDSRLIIWSNMLIWIYLYIGITTFNLNQI